MKINQIIDSNGSDVDQLIALFVKDHHADLTKDKIDNINKAMSVVGFGAFCERLQELSLFFELVSNMSSIELHGSGVDDLLLKIIPHKNKYCTPSSLKDCLKLSIEDRLADGFEVYYIRTFSSYLAKFLMISGFVII